ncbi:hypothetical protein P171DRAFT_491443 [Karstenula rhodostoma CBS 690.94]|uniref:Uncharacterized protein n=1 Tax=Karstenula rhodostoma CBS 690.94 TaxID=1392251 RepID=A0A9P4U5L6_9PLEO|nr:hypothetical protein P171DRAFT_491443 [Karstenula rhodostoma CBS 690.94]
MASPVRGKPPPINTQRLSALQPTTPSASSPHKCPCKRPRSPDCNCPHDKRCALRSVRPTPTTSSSVKSPFARGKYASTSTSTTTSPTYRNAFPGVAGPHSALHSPSTRPSAYEFGYDGCMSLHATAPLTISMSISVIKDLPRGVTRTFSGRVGRRKKRPKDIRVPKANEMIDTSMCICDMECNCRCWTLNSPIATRHSPMFDRDDIR